MERPIRVGDVITVGQLTGSVTRINIRATTVLNWDRQEILVPNRQLITQEVTNWTLRDAVTRLVIKIRVAHESDVDTVREMLLQIASAQPEVLEDPAPQALFLDQSAGWLDFELRVWLAAISQRLPMTDRLNTLIRKRLRELGIRTGFPQQEVYIRSGGLPTRAPSEEERGSEQRPREEDER